MGVLHFLVPGLEILIIAIVIYYLLSFFWNTRAMDLVLGLLAFLSHALFRKRCRHCSFDHLST
jgi:diadenylate cyclase